METTHKTIIGDSGSLRGVCPSCKFCVFDTHFEEYFCAKNNKWTSEYCTCEHYSLIPKPKNNPKEFERKGVLSVAYCGLCGRYINDYDVLYSELTDEPLCETCYEFESQEIENEEVK